MKSAISIVVAALVLTACAGSYNPQYRINEIVIVNNSEQAVRDVSIRSGGKVFSCGNIAPLGLCSNRFSRRIYQGGPIEVEWALGGGVRQSDSLQAGVPVYFATGLVIRGVLEISPEGEISAHFEQDEPFS